MSITSGSVIFTSSCTLGDSEKVSDQIAYFKTYSACNSPLDIQLDDIRNHVIYIICICIHIYIYIYHLECNWVHRSSENIRVSK